MPKLFIPTIGQELILDTDWNFKLHLEYRNQGLMNLYVIPWIRLNHPQIYDIIKNTAFSWDYYIYRAGLTTQADSWTQRPNINPYVEPIVTLKAGTVLKIDRIYIRKGNQEFDSVSFIITKSANPEITTKVRFWAKLVDVNTISFQ